VTPATPTLTSTPGTPTLSPTPATPSVTPTATTNAANTFQNTKYNFKFTLPPGSTVVSQSDTTSRVSLPVTAGTNLISKYIQISVREGVNPCVSPEMDNPTSSENVAINNIQFLKQAGQGAAAGNRYDWTAYSTARNNACISLAFVLHSANPGNYATPPPVFDMAKESAVIGTIMSTFNWITGGSGGTILLTDNFSSPGWVTGADSYASIQYANEALKFTISTEDYFIWSVPNDVDYQNIHMDVTVRNNGTHPTTAFGVICNQHGTDGLSYYYFAMTPGGQYAIAKAESGQVDVFLTNNGEWGFSSLIAQNASAYRIGADCGNGNLTLFVDGKQIVSASDSAFASGGIALFAWSGEEAASADVSFDDFVMIQL
jgi:hypothetical protein